MTYRNKKSGVMFTTSCVCDGEDWEEAKTAAPTPKAKRRKKQETAADAESTDGGGEDS